MNTEEYHKDLIELKEYTEKLSKGIDPITDITFEEDTILNNNMIKEYFTKILKKLNLELSKIKEPVNKKSEFKINNVQEIENIISKDPIKITDFVNNINENIYNEKMKKLRTIQITKWLVDNNYLAETTRIPTHKAKEIGIYEDKKTNNNNEKYQINLYNENAQRFILRNINKITTIYK